VKDDSISRKAFSWQYFKDVAGAYFLGMEVDPFGHLPVVVIDLI
jgi:hypothetical protein